MKYLSVEQQTVLLLLQRSLWKVNVVLPESADWDKVDTIAKENGVVSFLYDGAAGMKAEVPPEILQGWKTILLRGVVRNERLLRDQDKVITAFSQADIPAVVLKGSSVSRYYPQPGLRILGDIDILVGKEQMDAAKAILETLGYELCEADHDFHIGFKKAGTYVELHYEASRLPDSVGGCVTREIADCFLKEIHQGVVDTHVFPVLSECHQAIMLLLHMIRHMFGSGIGLRQLCDWAVYMNRVDPKIFMEQIIPILSRCGLLQYAKAATRTCIDYLGLPDGHLLWCSDVKQKVCQSFMADVFSSGNMGSADEAMGSLFTDGKTMGNEQSPLSDLIARVNRLVFGHFPVVKKYKILLPLAWVYLPLRYFVRSLLGLRPKKSAVKVVTAAKRRRKLYEMLDLFVIEEND